MRLKRTHQEWEGLYISAPCCKGKVPPSSRQEPLQGDGQENNILLHEGDIFQAVISNSISAHAGGSLFDVYRVLRTSNPSPYMFYLSSDDIEIAGASPETLLKLEAGS